jgi:hypothetical protein
MVFDPKTHCKWCTSSPGLEACTCTEPCRANLCPMREDGHLFPPTQPVPKFKKEDPK